MGYVLRILGHHELGLSGTELFDGLVVAVLLSLKIFNEADLDFVLVHQLLPLFVLFLKLICEVFDHLSVLVNQVLKGLDVAAVLIKLELNVAVYLLTEIAKHVCYSLTLLNFNGSVSDSELIQKLFNPISKFLVAFDFDLQLDVFLLDYRIKLLNIVR